MFSGSDGSIRSMRDAVERIKNASDSNTFDWIINDLRIYLKNLGMDPQLLIELERRAYYLSNEYSERDTKKRMEDAKRRVLEFLADIMDNHVNTSLICEVLENFYLFLENLLESEKSI